MEQQKQQISGDSIIYDRLPPAKYPWMFTDTNNAEENCQIFYNLNDPHSKYQCRIPELLGKRIRGCYHGWMILSSIDHSHWSLWNPLTSKVINLPPLILKDDGDYESIKQCCLSAPPHDPASLLVLTNTKKPTFVFCRIVCKRKRLIRWTEMSYVKQLERITGGDGSLLHSLACCNGKIYALNTDGAFGQFVIKVDILVKDREVLIKLSLFGHCPTRAYPKCFNTVYCLKGSRTELFFCTVGFHGRTRTTPGCVYSYKLNTTSRKCEEMDVFKGLDMTGLDWKCSGMTDRYKDLEMSREIWEEIEDLKDAIVFVDIARDFSVFYTTSKIASGFIHIRGIMEEIIYSYHVKKKTISISSMPFPTSNVLLWESRFEDNHGEAKPEEKVDTDCEIVVRSVTNQEVELNESQLCRIPFHILETIMELCVGVEYMKFRATCKLCLLAAPVIQRSNEIASTRLQTYSLISPWLLVVDKNQGILISTDPIFGDNYFMKKLQVSILYERLYCSRFGWLLFESSELECLVFFNPFTNDLLKLPDPGYFLGTLCFSAPPTSPDCMVVGFPPYNLWHVFIHFVAGEPMWETIDLGGDPVSIRFPTFYGPNVYGLTEKGDLFVLDVLGEEDYCYDIFESEATKGCYTSLPRHFLVKLDQHIVRVMVGDRGESVEVCKWNDSTEKWEKIDGIGKHTIFINYTTCVCIEATIPQMENKIFFSRLLSKNGKIVFYSLETCRYHTFNGENIEENFADFIGTDHHHNPHVWIEPSWS